MLSPRSHRNDIVALLDIGSSKITCAIAQRRRSHDGVGLSAIDILGFGQRRADGVRAGMVVDLGRAELGVRGAIGDAEATAGITIEHLTVALSSGRLSSSHFSAHTHLKAGHVRRDDLKRLAARAREYAERDGRMLVYLNRIHYTLDGATGIRDPNRMLGKRLSCQFHAVTGEPAQLSNLESLIERCYLSVRNFVPTSFAAAAAATTPDEQRLGVTCIDIGAGATKIAVISDRQFIYTDTLAVGGASLTQDISRMLAMPLAEAERIKALYGTVLYLQRNTSTNLPYWDPNSDRLVMYKALQGEPQETTIAELSNILYPRARRQLELIRERLEKSGLFHRLAQSVVLTGGGSQLSGLCSLASDVLGCTVRVGAPAPLAGLALEYQGVALSTVAGLGLIDAVPATAVYADSVKSKVSDSYMSRMEQWLRESF